MGISRLSLTSLTGTLQSIKLRHVDLHSIVRRVAFSVPLSWNKIDTLSGCLRLECAGQSVLTYGSVRNDSFFMSSGCCD